MRNRWLNCLFVVVVMMALTPREIFAAEEPSFTVKPATAETIAQLRLGGFVLYMRHGLTDTSKPDRVPTVDLNDCSTQRPLTEAGRQLATRVGAAIRKGGIPVGEVLASPMCRTRETAEAAFGKGYQLNNNLMYTSNLTAAEKVPRIENTRRLLSAPVPAGSNRVIVAHAPNLMDVIGYFPTPEAVVVVFKPLGAKGFEYVASIPPDQWAELVK
ncbi:MAG: histidine phosphatase family protein [Desulfobulbaceae bacterium]|nr:histidine phosphatase family protein [Desulfobulbaceae bacterium]HIJ90453.1 histidine phosphatase family protein [Deltaproteobacteria bacterium]